MQTIALPHATDWAGFTRAARWAVHNGVEPTALRWRAGDGTAPASLFDDEAIVDAASLPETVPLRMPGALVALLQRALLHRAPQRLDLAYRLLWRMAQPALRPQALDPLDDDRRRLDQLVKAVQRDMHKTKAFVRFRPCVAGDALAAETPFDGTLGSDAALQQVAWFEPDHHVLMAVAPFFARRFANLRWAILTPDMSVRWDGRALHPGPPAQREQAPGPDAGEALWLAYYASIFNPARTKPAMMKKEMPVRYWRNLPEAVLIAPLLAGAAERTGRMLAQTTPLQRQRRKGQGGVPPG